MNKIIKDSLILFAITAIAGLFLAFVNEVTKDPIEQQKIKAKQEACKNVFADAASFEETDEAFMNSFSNTKFNNDYAYLTIDEVIKALDDNGQVLGYVINISTKEGYGGNISFAMGVKNDRTLNGISILSSGETPGLGLEAETVLVPQFNNKKVDTFTYTKSGSTSDSEIDAITSATITTKAFVRAINGGLEYFDLLPSGNGGEGK